MKRVKEEALKKRTNVSQDVKLLTPHSPLLKLKIRNTTKYLNWRLLIIKRDNLTCKICHASVKENKKPKTRGTSS
jgi:hypothetical protein